MPKSYHFLTPVWGASYTKLFVDTVIPNQIGAGLAAFRDRDHYTIFTTQADAEAIRSAPIFPKLCNCVTVQFAWIDETTTSTHDRMSNCYRRGIAIADQADAGIVFLTPDMIFAAGSLARIKIIAELGRRAIFVTAIRTLKQQVIANLSDRAPTSRQLMRIALDNLHPLAISSFWHGEGDLLPANLYWPVGNEGIVARCFHLHPIYVYPQRKGATFFGTIDDDFFTAAVPDPSTDYVVTDSDEFLAIELSEPEHHFRTVQRKGSVADSAKWAEQFASERHRTLFNREILLHTKGTKNLHPVLNEATDVATAINGQLSLPWYRLLAKRGLPLLARLTRYNLDHRLASANGDRSSFLRSCDACLFWLVDRGIFAIRWSMIAAKTIAKRALIRNRP